MLEITLVFPQVVVHNHLSSFGVGRKGVRLGEPFTRSFVVCWCCTHCKKKDITQAYSLSPNAQPDTNTTTQQTNKNNVLETDNTKQQQAVFKDNRSPTASCLPGNFPSACFQIRRNRYELDPKPDRTEISYAGTGSRYLWPISFGGPQQTQVCTYLRYSLCYYFAVGVWHTEEFLGLRNFFRMNSTTKLVAKPKNSSVSPNPTVKVISMDIPEEAKEYVENMLKKLREKKDKVHSVLHSSPLSSTAPTHILGLQLLS